MYSQTDIYSLKNGSNMRNIDPDTFQRVFEYSSDIISIHDMEGNFLEVSPACEELLGYTQEELIGKSAYELFHPDDQEKVFSSYASIKEPPHIHKVDYRIYRKDGSIIWFESTSSLMYEDDEPLFISFSRDITKRVEAEEQLQAALESREKLLNILSHDLRSSFQALQVFSLLLAEDLEELKESEIKEYSEKIHISTVRVNDLLNNMIDWSKSHKDELTCNPTLLDIRDLIDEVIQLYTNQLEEKELEVEVELNDQELFYVDQEMCKSVFRNLISNAIKFSDPGDDIIIRNRMNGDRVLFEVIDHGVGMDSEKAETLFEGVNTSERGTAGEGGTGIGLTLARDFVYQHGGSIQAESQPGKGTTITFDLPASKDAFDE